MYEFTPFQVNFYLMVGITNCSTSSDCKRDDIDTQASTAKSRTESWKLILISEIHNKIDVKIKAIISIHVSGNNNEYLFILRQVDKHRNQI